MAGVSVLCATVHSSLQGERSVIPRPLSCPLPSLPPLVPASMWPLAGQLGWTHLRVGEDDGASPLEKWPRFSHSSCT